MAVADEAARRRRERERELVAATRALFDERGMQDAPVEEIARAVGIARGLIYRQFSSKEELFVLTVTDYLDELHELLSATAVGSTADPLRRLEDGIRAFAGFCSRYPAFLDCSLSLMQRPAMELNAIVSESVWLRLGRSMSRCVQHLIDILADGAAAGWPAAGEDPELLASVIWTQVLGAMHIARTRVGIRQTAAGEPELFAIATDAVIEAVVASAVATTGAGRP